MRAFTLVEIIVVVAILAVISSVGLVVGLESYRSALWRSDEDTLRSALLHARAQAMSGVCAASACTGPSAHGVHVASSSYTIFEGASYDTRHESEDEVLEGESSSLHSGLTEVAFSPLTGKVLAPGKIFVTNNAGKTSTTTMNSEGAILWGD